MLGTNDVTTYLCTILFIFIISVYWYFAHIYNYWKKRKICYIKPTIPFGNLTKVYNRKWTLGQAFGEAYLELKKMGAKHGGAFALNRPVYIPVDPNIIKHIMITDAANFIDHGFYLNTETDPLSAHMFNLEGSRWKEIRIRLAQAFSSAKIKNMFLTMVNVSEEFQKHLELCQKQYPNGINTKNEISKFTTEVISICGYGLDSNFIKGANEELLKHANLFFRLQWGIFKNSMVFAFPRNILKLINFKTFKYESNQFIRNMFEEIARYRKENNIQREDIANTILRMTEREIDENDKQQKKEFEPLNKAEYLAQMWVFFCASFESSATTTTFAIYELSLNRGYQEKLRDEISTVLSRHNNKITYEAVQEMTYLDNVINETLRLYPAFPILPRVCKENYRVPGTDFVLEKNSFVMVSNYGIQRDPDYYPDPLVFDPERFTPENKAKRPFITHLPFGEGPRKCIGKRFGLLQVKVGLATIIKNFEITLNKKTTPNFKFAPWELILRKSDDIWVNLKKIN